MIIVIVKTVCVFLPIELPTVDTSTGEPLFSTTPKPQASETGNCRFYTFCVAYDGEVKKIISTFMMIYS